MNRIPVWIDCDPGVGDAVAMLLANWLQELDIVGISTVAGNATLPITTENALKICDLMKKNYPVFAGADRPLMREYEAGESPSTGRTVWAGQGCRSRPAVKRVSPPGMPSMRRRGSRRAGWS